MIRFYVRLFPILTVSFMVMWLVSRTQPYDDRSLRQTIPPSGCPAPCFMNIRPGTTTAQEALNLLKSHGWISEVLTTNVDKPGQIWWKWNSNVPDFLKSPAINPTFPVNGEVHSSGGIVNNILFNPHLTLGDIVLAEGLPRTAQLIFAGVIDTPDRSVSAIVQFNYQASGFWVGGTLKCPYAENLWRTPAQLTITNEFSGMSLGTVRPIDRRTFIESIRRTSNIMCGV